MPSTIPIVEIADDGDAPRIGSPDGEVETFDAFKLERMSAHLVEQSQMRSLADEIIVHRSKNRTKAVGVGHCPFRIVATGAITHRLTHGEIDRAFEETLRIELLQFADERSVQCEDRHFFSPRNETPCRKTSRRFVNAEKCKGVGMQTALDRLDFSLRDFASLFLFGRIERFFIRLSRYRRRIAGSSCRTRTSPYAPCYGLFSHTSFPDRSRSHPPCAALRRRRRSRPRP